MKSIDFTGVLSDFWFVNKLVLMCYFFIKYDVFGWVREKPYFIRAERYFEAIFNDFWRYRKWWKCWFFKVLPNSVSNSKGGSRHGNIRYTLFGNRTFVLKCKPRRGCISNKRSQIYYNSTVLWYVFIVSSKNALHLR